MRIINLKLLTFIFVMTGFLLTACGNNTSYITDQTGKEIPVTSTDSDTYTFKLPSDQSVEPPKTDYDEPETTTTTISSDSSTASDENTDKESLASEGPKTGEP